MPLAEDSFIVSIIFTIFHFVMVMGLNEVSHHMSDARSSDLFNPEYD